MIGEALQQVEEIEREALRELEEMERAELETVTRFEYRTVCAYDDPEEAVNKMAAHGWRLHSVIADGIEERENHIHNGSTHFMIVMEREIKAPALRRKGER